MQELLPLGWVSSNPVHSSELVPLSSPWSQWEEMVILGEDSWAKVHVKALTRSSVTSTN